VCHVGIFRGGAGTLFMHGFEGPGHTVSRAFVKETDETFESLPDRPISKHQNLVTPEGLELIQGALARLRQDLATAQGANDRAAQGRIARDLRYWTSRHSTAQVVRAPKDATVVRFGCMVTIGRDDGRRQNYRIVGEDEADPTRGTLSYVSPIARALMGKQVGDVVRVGNSELQVLEINPSS
jgi:transcription elongation GreA/GreB family factor